MKKCQIKLCPRIRAVERSNVNIERKMSNDGQLMRLADSVTKATVGKEACDRSCTVPGAIARMNNKRLVMTEGIN